METLLNLIEKIVPLASFYPRWAQVLFLFTFALSLGSFSAFVVLYPVASRGKHDAETAEAAKQLSTEALQVIESDLKDIDALSADLGLALSSYYASGIALRLDLLDYTTKYPDIQTYVEKPLTANLREDVQDVIDKLGTLQAALSAIQRNRFAAACWNRATIKLPNGALTRVREDLLQQGFTESEATIEGSDISGLLQFFALAERRLRQFTFGPILTAVLATNSADIKGVGQGYDNAALRSLVFSGNLIFVFMTQSKKDPQASLVVSWGTAIMIDIFAAIPTEQIVQEELSARYPESSSAIQKLQLRLTPNSGVGADFRMATAELGKRPGLLFLELPPRSPT
jgi:hypothetical protein